MTLKPQDVYVVLKIVSGGAQRLPYAKLAAELGMSASEVHACVQRAHACHLLHAPKLQFKPNLSSLEEFLVHGLRYVFPPDRGEMTRGLPTAYAAPPLAGEISQGGDPIPVWPCEQGPARGVAFSPLYGPAPIAATRDRNFYEYLVLADALRDGRVRERQLARKELHRRFREFDA